MNQRNLLYIYPNNHRQDYPIADDKLKTKGILAASGIPMPETYKVYANFYELIGLENVLKRYPTFVIKPSRGRGGSGIIAASEYDGNLWHSRGGTSYSINFIRKHISDIIFGVFSFDLHDQAIVEEHIIQDEAMNALSPFGLADVRLIILKHRIAMAMLRVPTIRSDGKANLHQGAIGIGIDIENGKTTHAILYRKQIDSHPDTKVHLIGKLVPHWLRILDIGMLSAERLPLKYLGVDIAISTNGPVLLEINVRPGLEIQNANLAGLRRILETV